MRQKDDTDADPGDSLRNRVKVIDLGKMDNCCQFCKAVRFKKEMCDVCYLKGKVRLAQFSTHPMQCCHNTRINAV